MATGTKGGEGISRRKWSYSKIEQDKKVKCPECNELVPSSFLKYHQETHCKKDSKSEYKG